MSVRLYREGDLDTPIWSTAEGIWAIVGSVAEDRQRLVVRDLPANGQEFGIEIAQKFGLRSERRADQSMRAGWSVS